MAAAAPTAGLGAGSKRPRMIVFDLDACVWTPEMYELWGGGAPFIYDESTNTCTDSRGVRVRLLGAIPQILDDIKSWGGEIAIASRTDEPSWAREILNKFRTSTGETLMSCVTPNLDEMYKSSKTNHLSAIRQKSGCAFDDMIFFDDDPHNISDVSSIGVLSILTPNGVTRDVFEEGLRQFATRRGKLSE